MSIKNADNAGGTPPSGNIIPIGTRYHRSCLKLRMAAALPTDAEWTFIQSPLIDAAIDLLTVEDADFNRRCQAVLEQEAGGDPAYFAVRIDSIVAYLSALGKAVALAADRVRLSNPTTT